MTGQKKTMGIIIAALAILIIAAIIYSVNTKDSKGNGNQTPESATTEDVISGTTETIEEDTGKEAGADKNEEGNKAEGDKNQAGGDSKDSKQDKDKKASEATILDNQGDVEIIIPDEMGDGGF